ncbi:kielin/chordin-like protein isoform X2 [Anabrus simplex]|uniref:kielin/chordin-like protein isoform X2 n=1 Tax=Anabrus simplex TaxID=316456 RepID=UPI0035A265C3
MLRASLIFGFLMTLVAGLTPGDVDYQRMSNFYEDLGCLAVSGQGFYDCSNVLDTETPGKCTFQGRQFDDGEFLPTDVRLSGCKFGCVCYASNDTQPGTFNCPEVDCPHYQPLKPGCIRAFSSLDTCCPTQIVCENEVNITCSYGGKTFLEGEIFHPESQRCLMCRCQDNFGLTGERDGRPKTLSEGGSCQPIPCNIGVVKMEEVNQRCAPIFMTHACCPWEFYCPSGEERVIASDKEPGKQQCRLGSLQLNIGDEIETKDSSLKCFCYMPPFVTCHRTGF